VETVPQPHDVHGSLARPIAKNPLVHGTQGELSLESTMPCPGTHTHSVLFVVPTSVVVLFAGHLVHSEMLVISEKNPIGHIVQFILCANRPNPGLHLQSLDDCEKTSDSSLLAQGKGFVAPVSQ
jgi:hypothetical protein